MRKKILEGKLMLFSEQGMEGGRLAIVDNKYRQLSIPKYGLQENIKVWDNMDNTRLGITSDPESFLNDNWLPSRDPMIDEPDYRISSLFKGEIHGDLNADERLMRKYNFRIKYVKDRADEEYGLNNWKFTGHNRDIILKNGNVISMGETPTCIPIRPYLIPVSELSRVTVIWDDGTIETKRPSNTLRVESWGGHEAVNLLEGADYLKVLSPDSEKIVCEGQVDQIPLKTFSHKIKGHFENANEGNKWEECFTKEYNAELYREIKEQPPTTVV